MRTTAGHRIPVTALILVPAIVLGDPYPTDDSIDIEHYRFEITLSDTSDAITATATVRARVLRGGIGQIRLDLVNRSSELDGRGMVVGSVSATGLPLDFTHADDALRIKLPAAADPGQVLSLEIEYSGIPATGLIIGDNKYGERTFFSDNWPNKARNWLPTVDHISDKATSEFLVVAPNHYQVVSNGLLQEQSELGDNLRLTHWKQSVPIAPWLYVIGVARFAVQYVDEFDHKSIQTWVYRQDRDAGFYDFAVPARQALEFYSNHVGPFVYEKLANIQSNSVGGGMEAASAILYGDDSVTGQRTERWRYVIVHEIAHQWFGNSVTEASWDDVWLSEGFATYFSQLFFEYADGRDAFIANMIEVRNRIYEFHDDNPGYRIVHDDLGDMSEVTTRQTYDKGAWVLHMLRNDIGDESWWAGIRNYYRRYMNSHATTDDFRVEMEAACGCDLQPFFRQWLHQAGNIELAGRWHYDDEARSVEIAVSQTQDPSHRFSVNVEVGLYGDGDLLPAIHVLALGGSTARLSIPAESRPGRVVIDPRTVLLARWSLTEDKAH